MSGLDKNTNAYKIGRIFGAITVWLLFALTALVIVGLGYKFICWMFGI